MSQASAESYILSRYKANDFTEREALNTIKSAYKLRSFGSKYFEDYTKIKSIKNELKNGKDKVVEKYHISDEVFESIREENEVDDFWYSDKKGKICIDALKYKIFLERHGFNKCFIGDSLKPVFVKIDSNIVTETSIEILKDFVLDYLLDKGEIEAWNRCVNYANLFSEQYLLMLESIELSMLRDTKEKSYIAFKNGILEVTKDSIELNDYIDVSGYVWKSHIIDRDFIELDDDSNQYKSFINLISSEQPYPIESVIGYLLSTYKNKLNNKAVILNDEVISDNAEGGTGKGVFVQGIRQMRRVEILDGKVFDGTKQFAYQTVSQDTNILVFDDVKKGFDFESKFSLVTEGITLERKNKDAIRLSVEDSPKMVISTNYAIKGEGNSHNRRRHEIEFSQYFGRKVTPFDEFGCQLFDDWDSDEFAKFDNYMVKCLQIYLKDGLVKQNAKNLVLRKLMAETSMEFFEWVSDREQFPINKRVDKVEAFTQFTNEYKDFQKWLTRKRFNIWVDKYGKYKGYEFSQGSSQGMRWMMLSDGSENDVESEIEF